VAPRFFGKSVQCWFICSASSPSWHNWNWQSMESCEAKTTNVYQCNLSTD